MATVWITYAWANNEHVDVDYVAQELERAGVTVKMDRWNLGAGKRLWEQIETFICGPEQSDAWLLIATSNSLQSEACKEEFTYALDRALRTRGEVFPLVALFPTVPDQSLIPAAIRARLHVSITDPDWKERVVAAVEKRPPVATRQEVRPYHLRIYSNQGPGNELAIEVRPRAGVWAPFFAAIPLAEKEAVELFIMIGPSDVPTHSGMLTFRAEGRSDDNSYWMIKADNQCTPTQSYYVWCKKLPSELRFGVPGPGPQFTVAL